MITVSKLFHNPNGYQIFLIGQQLSLCDEIPRKFQIWQNLQPSADYTLLIVISKETYILLMTSCFVNKALYYSNYLLIPASFIPEISSFTLQFFHTLLSFGKCMFVYKQMNLVQSHIFVEHQVYATLNGKWFGDGKHETVQMCSTSFINGG